MSPSEFEVLSCFFNKTYPGIPFDIIWYHLKKVIKVILLNDCWNHVLFPFIDVKEAASHSTNYSLPPPPQAPSPVLLLVLRVAPTFLSPYLGCKCNVSQDVPLKRWEEKIIFISSKRSSSKSWCRKWCKQFRCFWRGSFQNPNRIIHHGVFVPARWTRHSSRSHPEVQASRFRKGAALKKNGGGGYGKTTYPNIS